LPLFPAVPPFFLFSPCFALQPAVSSIPHSFHSRFWTIFEQQIRINSATNSLRNSWAFTCSICGKTVTQQRFPSHVPKYCSAACKESQPNQEAMREQTRLRVAAWRKAHPDARRKPKETDA